MDIGDMKISKVTTSNLKPISAETKQKVTTTKLTSSVPTDEVHVDDAKTIANGELKIDFASLAQSMIGEHLLDNTNND